MPPESVSDATELGWVVGFFCGEGTTSAHANRDGRYYLNVHIGNTDREGLERCQSVIGGKIYGPYAPRSALGRRPMYHLKIDSKVGAEAAIRTMWPLMSTEKREQAERARAKVASNPPLIPHRERKRREKR